tara:strand:- start:7233 stop:7889 length:657 start_codon:yes stop_codon:yes gene_type:complete
MGLINPRVTALAKVTSGWTGTLTVTDGASTAIVTPKDRTSAFEVMTTLGAEIVRVFGVTTHNAWCTSSGIFQMTGPSTFSVTGTGTTEARMGLSGALSGASEYTFPGAYTGAVIPGYGLRTKSPMVSVSDGSATSTGANASTGGAKSSGASLFAFDDFSGVFTISASLDQGETYDAHIWRDDDRPPLVRLRVRSVSIRRWGVANNQARIEARCVEVKS